MAGLSVVIPVYNEEKAIRQTLEELRNILQASGISFELIVVDDGSTDRTRSILSSCDIPHRLLIHEINRGYGASLKTGIREASFDIIGITDADGTYPNERIPEFYREMDIYAMVVGQRKFRHLPIKTLPAKWMLTRLANYLAGYKIPDLNSGLRLFRKKEAMSFFNIISDGFSFTTTITLSMLTNNLPVKYIPIEYFKRKGKSKIKPFYDTMNFTKLIIRTVLYFDPLKIFLPLSMFLFLASLAVLAYSYFWLPRILDTTFFLLIISAIQILAIGMLADMIAKRMK
jgi:glycosyltransferase involved in cell wall biosynthesis